MVASARRVFVECGMGGVVCAFGIYVNLRSQLIIQIKRGTDGEWMHIVQCEIHGFWKFPVCDRHKTVVVLNIETLDSKCNSSCRMQVAQYLHEHMTVCLLKLSSANMSDTKISKNYTDIKLHDIKINNKMSNLCTFINKETILLLTYTCVQ